MRFFLVFIYLWFSWSVSAVTLKVTRPELAEAITLSNGFTFVIGTVTPADSKVVCNGVNCDVSDDGAFIGFVPICLIEEWPEIIGKKCDTYFELVAQHDDEETALIIPTFTPYSPSAAILAEEIVDPPQFIRVVKDQWIGLEGERLGKVVLVPSGTLLPIYSTNSFGCRSETSQGLEIVIPPSEVQWVPSESTENLSPKVYELSIPNQKTVRLREDGFRWKRLTNHIAWGVSKDENDSVIHIRPSLRGDGDDVDTEHPLKGFHVCLDPGHHPDRGAVGPRGLEERELNLLVAREVAKLLEAEGSVVSFTREENPLTLRERHERLHQLNPDLVISIHHNSVRDGEDPRLSHGTQTFYLYPWSKPLAASVHRSILDKLGTKNLGGIRRNLYIPRFPECPTILIEPEYIILPEQEEKFMDPDHRRKLAEAIVEGIRNFVLK